MSAYYAQASDPMTGRLVYPRLVPTPMQPLDVAMEPTLDTMLLKSFYRKRIENFTGDAITLLFTWLIKVQDKALEQAWLATLTIDGKLLTTSFAEITMEQMRAQAQVIQDYGGRGVKTLLCFYLALRIKNYHSMYQSLPVETMIYYHETATE